jgi:hypothetical protein
MAKSRRDVCARSKSEPLWRAGRGFVVRDLPECARPRAQQCGQASRNQIEQSAQQLGHCSGRGRPHSAVIALGVSAERRHLKISEYICGGPPTRRYEEEESSAVPLKIGATGFAGRGFIFRRVKFLARANGASGPPP